MTELSKTIAGIIKDNQQIKRGIGETGSVAYKFQLFPEKVTIEDRACVISTRGLGSSFILTHSDLGRLGTVTGTQPYLGDSRGSWVVTRVVSDDNTFKEWFDDTRFKDSTNTTANWQTGSSKVYYA